MFSSYPSVPKASALRLPFQFSRFTGVAVLSATAAMAFAAPAAHADGLLSSATQCDNQSAEQPFTRWNDNNSYVLAPDGGLEDGGDGWSLTGAAHVASGNESYFVHDAGDSSSLALPSGSSATTGPVCVDLSRPTRRFFTRSTSTLLPSLLRVDVLFASPLGGTVSLPIGLLTQNSQWKPSPSLAVIANLLAVLPGGQTPVAFRFTAMGGATWSVDDVYIDPKGRS